MSSQPDQAVEPGVANETSVRTSNLVQMRQIVEGIDEGTISWDILTSLHRDHPVYRMVNESFGRTRDEWIIADRLGVILKAHHGQRDGFEDVAHSVITHVIDRSPIPPSLLGKPE